MSVFLSWITHRNIISKTEEKKPNGRRYLDLILRNTVRKAILSFSIYFSSQPPYFEQAFGGSAVYNKPNNYSQSTKLSSFIYICNKLDRNHLLICFILGPITGIRNGLKSILVSIKLHISDAQMSDEQHCWLRSTQHSKHYNLLIKQESIKGYHLNWSMLARIAPTKRKR